MKKITSFMVCGLLSFSLLGCMTEQDKLMRDMDLNRFQVFVTPYRVHSGDTVEISVSSLRHTKGEFIPTIVTATTASPNDKNVLAFGEKGEASATIGVISGTGKDSNLVKVQAKVAIHPDKKTSVMVTACPSSWGACIPGFSFGGVVEVVPDNEPLQ
jgi:hypothetical protein